MHDIQIGDKVDVKLNESWKLITVSNVMQDLIRGQLQIEYRKYGGIRRVVVNECCVRPNSETTIFPERQLLAENHFGLPDDIDEFGNFPYLTCAWTKCS